MMAGPTGEGEAEWRSGWKGREADLFMGSSLGL